MVKSVKAKRNLLRAARWPVVRSILQPMMRFKVSRWDLDVPSLGALDQLRIGIITDLHWGLAPMSARKLDAIKRRLAALDPDVIVFLGDIAGGFHKKAKARNVEQGAALLAGLNAPLGAYAILGNHDWQDDLVAHALETGPVAGATHLAKAGFRVLQNTSVELVEGSGLYLAGLDSQRAIKRKPWYTFRRDGKDDLAHALRDIPAFAPTILLAHEPDIFPEIQDERISLVLSGHTHAGQIRVMDRPIATPSRHGTRFAYGHFRILGRQLVVSSGLGASTIPLRIGTVPEIALITVSSLERI